MAMESVPASSLMASEENSPQALAERFLAAWREELNLSWAIEFDDADDDDDDDDDDDKDDLELKATPDSGPTTLNQMYTSLITASGGEPPYTIVLDPKHNTLPAGLGFVWLPGADTATIAGVPTAAGSYKMYKVYAIDTEGGYDSVTFKAGSISASTDVGTADPAAESLFATLGDSSSAALTAPQTKYVEYALSAQDPVSGKPPAAENNPNAKGLSAEETAAADRLVQSWLRLGDNEIWENLSAALAKAGSSISRPLQVRILQLCSATRSRTVAERKAIEAYHKQWSHASRLALVRELAKTPDIAEMCSYMSTYRPSGLLRNPPFSAGADAVLIAIAHKWKSL
jgi:hypothetical protein